MYLKADDRALVEGLEIARERIGASGHRVGERASCLLCGGTIVRGLSCWEHVGKRPRHPARPGRSAPMPGTIFDPAAVRHDREMRG
jgi:hypothetical protein